MILGKRIDLAVSLLSSISLYPSCLAFQELIILFVSAFSYLDDMAKRKRKARTFAPSKGKKTSNVVLARTDSVIPISSKRSIEDGARESEIDDSVLVLRQEIKIKIPLSRLKVAIQTFDRNNIDGDSGRLD